MNESNFSWYLVRRVYNGWIADRKDIIPRNRSYPFKRLVLVLLVLFDHYRELNCLPPRQRNVLVPSKCPEMVRPLVCFIVRVTAGSTHFVISNVCAWKRHASPNSSCSLTLPFLYHTSFDASLPRVCRDDDDVGCFFDTALFSRYSGICDACIFKQFWVLCQIVPPNALWWRQILQYKKKMQLPQILLYPVHESAHHQTFDDQIIRV